MARPLLLVIAPFLNPVQVGADTVMRIVWTSYMIHNTLVNAGMFVLQIKSVTRLNVNLVNYLLFKVVFDLDG